MQELLLQRQFDGLEPSHELLSFFRKLISLAQTAQDPQEAMLSSLETILCEEDLRT
jgi:hypothetical protein